MTAKVATASGTAGPFTTVPAAPSSATFSYSTALASNGNYYSTVSQATTATPPTVIAAGTDATFSTGGAGNPTISFALADSFGNAIALNTPGLTAYTITLTALSGGGFFNAAYAAQTAYPAVLTCTGPAAANWQTSGNAITSPATVACPTGAITTVALPFLYFQSGAYSTIGKLSVTITGTYNSGGFSGSGTSASLVTSTFAGASATPAVAVPTGATYTIATVPAGSTVVVSETLGTLQAGVPVTLYLDHAASYETAVGAKDYGANSLVPAVFSGGTQAITAYTGSSGASLGVASATFTVDTVMGSHAQFQANVAAPTITGGATNMLGNSTSGASATAITVAGAPASFVISPVCFKATPDTPATCGADNDLVGTSVAAGATVFVDISVADAYGNTAANPGPNQIQVTLAAAGSTLSSTTTYILMNNPDTYPTNGWVAWTFPTTVGTAITLTASGVLSGKSSSSTDKVTTVSDLPTISVTSPAPLSGVIYSGSTSVVFSGEANVSTGYSTNIKISSVGFKVDSNPWQSGVISSANQVVFSLAATMTAGLHTIQFNATDTLSNTVVSQSFKVLVDTAAPTITATTTSGSSISAGSPVVFSIVDPEGDLNASSVVATSNSTATLTATVTGTNNPGSSVTYTINVNGLPTSTGHWSVTLNANDYAGNAATAVTITVKVTVAFAQSVVLQGTASQTTIGGFPGISATFSNEWSSSQNLIVFAVWKNSAGQTVAVSTSGLTLAAGATGTAFAPLAGSLPSGSYTVNIFVWTTSNQSVSSTTSISGTF
ncbi:MAG: hypothetical protein JRM80_06305 [Nitrososphaerota archaeon]|nr:hypothetical protein [Nitrososphaerota archaeon]